MVPLEAPARRRIHWISLAIIVVFGGATLLLHDETFIKWKPTVLYAPLRRDSGRGQARLRPRPDEAPDAGHRAAAAVWTRLTWSWVAFFAFMGVTNWYVAFNYTDQTWVNFKVWGGIGLFLLFALAQGLWLARHMTGGRPMTAVPADAARAPRAARADRARDPTTTAPPTPAMPAPPAAAGTFRC